MKTKWFGLTASISGYDINNADYLWFKATGNNKR
jgi:hypothetical protein